MRFAAVQMASGSNLQGNMREAERLIQSAAEAGADLVVLPENFGVITAVEAEILDYGEPAGQGPLQDFLAEQAQRHRITLAGGSVPLLSDEAGKVSNALLVYGPRGELVSRYDKIHLFDVLLADGNERYDESSIFSAGNEVIVFESNGVKVGLAICYDLRFPEMFRELSSRGAEVILLPAAFTAETGKAHWHTLLKARAIENLSYVVASAQGGFHVNGRETYGHSMIIDPWGNVLDEHDSGPGVVIADFNREYQQQIRHSFPVLTHRKLS
jgi:nitrilase